MHMEFHRTVICLSTLVLLAGCGVESNDTSQREAESSSASTAAYESVAIYRVASEEKVFSLLTYDFDHDGTTDVFPNGHDQTDQIYLRNSDTFEALMPLHSPGAIDRHGCAMTDVEGADYLYCTQGADAGAGAGLNELFIGDGTGYFERIEQHGAEEPTGRSRLASFMNFDGDDLPDLYVTVWHVERTDDEPNENTILRNTGNMRFEQVATAATGAIGTKCLVTDDLNNDGFDDIVLCDHSSLGSKVFLNDGRGDFNEITSRLGLSGRQLLWTDADVGFVDNNEYLDLVVSHAGAVQVFYDVGNLEVATVRTERISVGSYVAGIALSDLNRDGQLDIYAAKREHWNTNQNSNDVVDQIYLGPTWDQMIEVPAADTPSENVVFYPSHGVVVAHASHNSGGEVWVVELE